MDIIRKIKKIIITQCGGCLHTEREISFVNYSEGYVEYKCLGCNKMITEGLYDD